MDLRPSMAVAAAMFGLEATVTPAGADPIATTAFWLPPRTVEVPAGEFRRVEVQRVVVVQRNEVPELPLGSVIAMAEIEGGDVEQWRVDGVERADAEHYRALVVPA